MFVECTRCEATVDGIVVADYVQADDEAEMLGKYSFLRCPVCSNPLIVVQIDTGYSSQPTWDEPYRIYPPMESNVSLAIPHSLRTAYDEARKCLKVKA